MSGLPGFQVGPILCTIRLGLILTRCVAAVQIHQVNLSPGPVLALGGLLELGAVIPMFGA